MTVFKDRKDAGQQLAKELSSYTGRNDVIVLGLARGGVAVGVEVARNLKVPMDVYLVRKLGVPGYEELAMGAIASGGTRIINSEVIRSLSIPDSTIDEVTAREKEELKRRETAYRGDRPFPDLRDKTVILVDDGLATGASMRAAISAVKSRSPRKIIVAVPTAPLDTFRNFKKEADELVCLETPQPFMGVGGSYEDFSQLSDEEVKSLLDEGYKIL